MTKIATRTRRSVIWLAYLGLACRMLIPAGYMPAPLDQGGPIILCHGGVAGQLLEHLGAATAGHRAHAHGDASTGTHEDSSGQHAAWELCPLGTVLGAVALTGEFDFQFATLDHPAPVAEVTTFTTHVLTSAYWARAPPSPPSRLI